MLFLYLYMRCLVKPSKGYFNRIENMDDSKASMQGLNEAEQAPKLSSPMKEEKKEEIGKPPLPPKPAPPKVSSFKESKSSLNDPQIGQGAGSNQGSKPSFKQV